MRDRPRSWQRRALLLLGAAAAVGWVIGAPRLAGLWRPALVFRDLPDLPPFRELESSGAVSVASVALAGLDPAEPRDPAQEARIARVRADPCTALFGPGPDPRLPIAFFSDFNCPNCQLLNGTLEQALVARPEALRLVRHQLPLLGRASALASEAVLAADLQGGYAAMHDRLMRARMVTDLNLVVRLAKQAGLDGERLAADMQNDRIAGALDASRAIATVFGFYGTPATVIGRAVFLGNLPAANVARIIDTELAALPMQCAGG